MTKLNIAISEEDIGWAKSRVAAGETESIEAYFSQLAKRDKAEAEEAEWLQGEIDKGLTSGVDPRSSRQIFTDVKAKYLGENDWPRNCLRTAPRPSRNGSDLSTHSPQNPLPYLSEPPHILSL